MASKRGGHSRESHSDSGRQVNNLLGALRGEQFRHQQNLLRSKLHATSSLQSKPTLPLDQIFGTGSPASGDVEPVQPAPFREPGQPGHRRDRRPPVTLIEGVPTYAYPNGAVPGPKPPKSWIPLFDGDERDEPAWRANAFKVLLDDLGAEAWLRDGSHAVMPLAMLCAQTILKTYGESEALVDVVQYIPPHLKRDLIRWHTVHRPLSNSKLYALCGEEGHADGELLVVGPHNNLRGDVIKGRERTRAFSQGGDDGEQTATSSSRADDWDAPTDTPASLTVIGLLESPLPSSVIFSLPPTLTHLALLALPHPIPVHRLPRQCPLLEVLDISFNGWLSGHDDPYPGTFNAVDWKRWGYLRILGLRECGVSKYIVHKVNANRWTDVEVIGADDSSRDVHTIARSNVP
ncbi:hypothetical protein PHLGIDRAFT_34427 [Phlebiopsis gigantea 11061_1 CR5-6]|uniref:Uncharacterized protein n=1 Tax=Phlebiopsis gigantea (strain 11061_1 CR5-6) TaxID=745531 RepID=A0A0C3PQV7_PHLG1|nr:hypothetical protein PHLGIDRAFT_34427 [Phlebiopsis gigantea 11061_1 CR5-6]